MMKVLILVKTYPAISTKYGETVCTAGITEDGNWVRIYPIPFRKINYKTRFKKYEWIEADLIENQSDFRPESFRPVDYEKIHAIDEIKPDGNTWEERREYVLKNIYTNLETLIKDAKDKNKCTSLAVKQKYFEDFAKTKDYYFFLGTTKMHHYTAPNPFVIIGDFRPKPIVQEELF